MMEKIQLNQNGLLFSSRKKAILNVMLFFVPVLFHIYTVLHHHIFIIIWKELGDYDNVIKMLYFSSFSNTSTPVSNYIQIEFTEEFWMF